MVDKTQIDVILARVDHLAEMYTDEEYYQYSHMDADDVWEMAEALKAIRTLINL